MTKNQLTLSLPDQRHTLRAAWVLLLVSFAVFCTLLVSTAYGAWHYRATAADSQQGTLIVRAPAELVTWRRKNRASFERTHDLQMLEAGDQVRIARSAGYGQAATVRLFDQSTLDMWAGADLLLAEMQTSRWNNHMQYVRLQQHAGYIRYDLHSGQPYQEVTFLVQVGQSEIVLAPGGSYSIEITPSDRQMLVAGTETFIPILIDVAVRTGLAEVHSQGRRVSMRTGQRVQVGLSGIPSEPQPALWQLIRDGDFSTYTEQEYNNTTIVTATNQPTLVRSDTWQVYSGSQESNVMATGFFKLAHGCRPPRKDNDCDPDDQTNIAWFIRDGGQTRPFVTGVRQFLGSEGHGIDISEYRSLIFSVWVRVLNQSIPLTGDEGTECPVMLRFLTKQNNPTDAEQERVVCFYSSSDPAAEPERKPGITYQRVAPFEWHYFSVDLRSDSWLPEARYMRSIEIYANGHDYNSRVTGVSLIGSHYTLPSDRDMIPSGEQLPASR